MKKPLVIVLLGPTASGKTELSIDLATKLKISIHNVDSRQIYKGMDIGTAKPTKIQQQQIPHHLIDIKNPNEEITVQEFHEIALEKIQTSLLSESIALLVGGSGLYLKAITCGLTPPKVGPQKSLRDQLSEMPQTECHQILASSDDEAAKRISPNDIPRTQRALEVLYATGKSITQLETSQSPPWKILELGLDPKNLKERIHTRTHFLYNNGLVHEAFKLKDTFGEALPLLQTIGYREALQVINGDINNDDAISLTKIRTNQLAKKQRTWFRNKHNPKWLNDEQPLIEALSLIQDALR